MVKQSQGDNQKSLQDLLAKILEFTVMTGDQILADRKVDWKNEEHKWERKVLQFKQWMLEAPKKGTALQFQSPNSARGAAMVARSFFSYYYMPLHYRRQESKSFFPF